VRELLERVLEAVLGEVLPLHTHKKEESTYRKKKVVDKLKGITFLSF
jgi:hypothetical protein